MYFKFDLDWLMDLDMLESVIYGLILNAEKNNHIKNKNGKTYKSIPNNYIKYWLPNMSDYKIKDRIDDLVDDEYIEVLMTKYQFKSKRYVLPLITELNDTIYVFKEWLENYNLRVCLALGVMFRSFVQSGGEEKAEFDIIEELYPPISLELEKLDLISNNELTLTSHVLFNENKKVIFNCDYDI